MDRNSTSNFGIYRASNLALARERWRDAERVVTLRWEGFIRSERESRTLAFASYVAALDAEAAAAAEMSRLLPNTAVNGTGG
jgi:hypothetical protein